VGKCFVIQPFDQGPFDKRYEEVIAPAATDAGLQAYRVDRDPSVTVPIETIEAETREADACVADITDDNPNVWYELGYAFAQGKDVVMICAKGRRTKFPFDVQHRNILTYGVESPSDFTKLREGIAARLKAGLTKREQLQATTLLPPAEQTEGLAPHEIAVLVVLMENRPYPNYHTGAYEYLLKKPGQVIPILCDHAAFCVGRWLSAGSIQDHWFSERPRSGTASSHSKNDPSGCHFVSERPKSARPQPSASRI